MSVCLGNNPRDRCTGMKQCCRPLTSSGQFQALHSLSSLSPVVLKKREEMSSACGQVEGAECRSVQSASSANTHRAGQLGRGQESLREGTPTGSPTGLSSPLHPASLSAGTSQEGEPGSPSECVKELKEPVPPNKAEHPLAQLVSLLLFLLLLLQSSGDG